MEGRSSDDCWQSADWSVMIVDSVLTESWLVSDDCWQSVDWSVMIVDTVLTESWVVNDDFWQCADWQLAGQWWLLTVWWLVSNDCWHCWLTVDWSVIIADSVLTDSWVISDVVSLYPADWQYSTVYWSCTIPVQQDFIILCTKAKR